MSISGFDWLNIASKNNSDTGSPAPPVSFVFQKSDDVKGSDTTVSTTEGNTRAPVLMNEVKSQSLENFHTRIDTNDSLIHQEDSSIPLSLTASELSLEESKTYVRWYNDILARTNSRTITMYDVFNFLHNFKISEDVKNRLVRLFSKILYSINIGEFFALIRLISHALFEGKMPIRRLIKEKSKILTPPSILSKKRLIHEDSSVDDQKSNNIDGSSYGSGADNTVGSTLPLDLDSFTQFMLTGKRPEEAQHTRQTKKLKSVKFSDQVVTDIHDPEVITSPSPSSSDIDYSLPMDKLMEKLNNAQTQSQKIQSEEEERELLKDMESEINHFQNLHSVDTASVGGVPVTIDISGGEKDFLRPNMTGPKDMARIFSPSLAQENGNSQRYLQPNMTGPNQLKQFYSHKVLSDDGLQYNTQHISPVPNPSDMARIFSPSPTQETKDKFFTVANSQPRPSFNDLPSVGSPLSITGERVAPPPVPTRRSRSVSSPTPHNISGHSDYSSTNESYWKDRNMNQSSLLSNSNTQYSNISKPRPAAPLPPPSRRRSATTSANSNAGKNSSADIPQIHVDSPLYSGNNDSTANILDDLKALQEEVDKIRDMTEGF